MPDKIGPRELRLRELAQQTRAGKNLRARKVRSPSQVLDELRKDVAKVAAKKKRAKRHRKGRKPR